MLPRKHFSSLLRVKELSTDFHTCQPREKAVPPNSRKGFRNRKEDNSRKSSLFQDGSLDFPGSTWFVSSYTATTCFFTPGCFSFTKPWKQECRLTAFSATLQYIHSSWVCSARSDERRKVPFSVPLFFVFLKYKITEFSRWKGSTLKTDLS